MRKRLGDMAEKKILIIDDEEDFVKMLTRNLELHGYHVEGCTTARQALNRVKKKSYDIVLVDFKMPKMGGDVIIEKIQEICPTCKFIILTGFSVDGKVREILETNPKVCACLQKPFEIKDLVSEIEKGSRR
ncbi:response regulator [Acidobacteria bacterium AH-259-G07]|nr:response regulator [Acidobacteria bacterium AH-259-G07]